MNKKTKKENENTMEEFSALNDLADVVSTTEYTGIMQIPPSTPEQAAAYGKMFEVPEQVNVIPEKHTKKK